MVKKPLLKVKIMVLTLQSASDLSPKVLLLCSKTLWSRCFSPELTLNIKYEIFYNCVVIFTLR